jgi:guanine deaminase
MNHSVQGDDERANRPFFFKPSRRRFLTTGMVGFGFTAVMGTGLVKQVWAMDQEVASKPFDQAMGEKFMRRAIELSQKAWKSGDGAPFGCVIVKDGEIVGEGWNRRNINYDPTAHSEIEAIRDAGKKLKTYSLKGYDLYTSGQPCPMCLSACYWAEVDRIFMGTSAQDHADFGFSDAFVYQALAAPAGKRPIPERHLLRNEALQVFKDFTAAQAKPPRK